MPANLFFCLFWVCLISVTSLGHISYIASENKMSTFYCFWFFDGKKCKFYIFHKKVLKLKLENNNETHISFCFYLFCHTWPLKKQQHFAALTKLGNSAEMSWVMAVVKLSQHFNWNIRLYDLWPTVLLSPSSYII